MFGDLDTGHMQQALEALLFVTDEPVSTITLADMLEADTGDVETALLRLRADLAKRESGIQLAAVAGGWRLVTHPLYHDLLSAYVLSWDTRRLTQAALETLAIIAYLQPVTRNAVASVRGVNSDSSINSLIDKGLVREAGTLDAPGNPMQYATTRTFLEKFGLRSVKDLPPLESYAPDADTAELLRQGLSAHGLYDQAAFAEEVSEDSEADSPGAQGDDVGVSSDGNAVGAESIQETLRRMANDALAESAGAVEKINFDDLEFEE
jgi:segregation and condensation protein B